MRYVIGLVVVAALLLIGMVAHRSLNRGQPKASPVAASTEKVLTISTGEKVDIARHAVQSGFTLVEFTAEF
jgi:hypothetical protein